MKIKIYTMKTFLVVFLTMSFLPLFGQWHIGKSEREIQGYKGNVKWVQESSYKLYSLTLKELDENVYMEFTRKGEYQYIIEYDKSNNKAHHYHFYTHNKAGNKTMCIEIINGVFAWLTNYSYDENNRIVEERTIKKSNTSSKIISEYSSKKIYSYYDDKRLKAIISYGKDSAVVSDKKLYSYNDIENSELEEFFNSDDKVIMTWKRIYNSDGEIKNDILDDSDSEYSYNKRGDIEKIITPRPNDKNPEQIEEKTMVYTYDSIGNWVEQYVFTNSKPTKYIVRTISYYDESIKPKTDFSKKIQRIFIPNKNIDQIYQYTTLRDGSIKISDYWGTTESIQIPSEIDGKPVTVIGAKSFYKSGVDIRNIILPQTIVSIHNEAFAVNKLEKLTLPQSIVAIGNKAFSLNKLTKVEIPGSIEVISNNAFSSNELQAVIFNEGLKEIGEAAFSGNKISSLKLPNTLQRIEKSAFMSNSINEVLFGNSLEFIGSNAFFANGELEVRFPKSERENQKLSHWESRHENLKAGSKLKKHSYEYKAVFK